MWVSILSFLTLWGEESSLGRRYGYITLLLRLRRLLGALTLVAVQKIPGSVKEVPDADEGPGIVQVSLFDHVGGGREVIVKVYMGICWFWVSLLSLPTMWKEEERRRGDGVSVPSDLVGGGVFPRYER